MVNQQPAFNFYIFFYVLLFFSQTAFAQNNILNKELAQEEAIWNLKEKYATFLDVKPDSLINIKLLEVIDKWPEYLRENPECSKLQKNVLFAQFVYYLVYDARIPGEVNQLFSNATTYPFRNLTYLKSGDLLFWGKEESKPEMVAIYLQNNFLAFANADGGLEIRPLLEIGKHANVLGAKVKKDE